MELRSLTSWSEARGAIPDDLGGLHKEEGGGVPEPVSEWCGTRETHEVVAAFKDGRGLGAASSFSESPQRRNKL